MLKHLIIASAVALTTVLSGCATGPSKQELANADYGPQPTGREINEAVASYRDNLLIDPTSALIKEVPGYSQVHIPLTKVWASGYDGENIYGWAYDFMLNAKNQMGGYTGWKRIRLIIRYGKLYATQEQYQNSNDYTFAKVVGR